MYPAAQTAHLVGNESYVPNPHTDRPPNISDAQWHNYQQMRAQRNLAGYQQNISNVSGLRGGQLAMQSPYVNFAQSTTAWTRPPPGTKIDHTQRRMSETEMRHAYQQGRLYVQQRSQGQMQGRSALSASSVGPNVVEGFPIQHSAGAPVPTSSVPSYSSQSGLPVPGTTSSQLSGNSMRRGHITGRSTGWTAQGVSQSGSQFASQTLPATPSQHQLQTEQRPDFMAGDPSSSLTVRNDIPNINPVYQPRAQSMRHNEARSDVCPPSPHLARSRSSSSLSSAMSLESPPSPKLSAG